MPVRLGPPSPCDNGLSIASYRSLTPRSRIDSSDDRELQRRALLTTIPSRPHLKYPIKEFAGSGDDIARLTEWNSWGAKGWTSSSSGARAAAGSRGIARIWSIWTTRLSDSSIIRSVCRSLQDGDLLPDARLMPQWPHTLKMATYRLEYTPTQRLIQRRWQICRLCDRYGLAVITSSTGGLLTTWRGVGDSPAVSPSMSRWQSRQGLAHPVLLHPGGRRGAERRHEPRSGVGGRHHTLGSSEMGVMGRALFCADYLEPNRTYISDEERARLLEEETIASLCLKVVEREWRHLIQTGRSIAHASEAFRRSLKEEVEA